MNVKSIILIVIDIGFNINGNCGFFFCIKCLLIWIINKLYSIYGIVIKLVCVVDRCLLFWI